MMLKTSKCCWHQSRVRSTILHTLGHHNEEMQEFCQLQQFQAQCPAGNVIVMEKAQYGRMRLGQCVKNAYGNLGCHGDVIMQMDRKCSGRHTCEFMVAELHGSQNCPEDLTPFLLASHTCVEVYNPERNAICSAGQPVTVTSSSGFLANVITETTQVGSEACPWMLSAQPGQRFNLTVVNFARAPNVGAAEEQEVNQRGSPRICYQLAVILENGVRRTVTECEGGPRVGRPFLSSSHQLQISMINRKSHDVYFLMKFQVIGCGTPRIPRGAHLRREAKVATIKCNFTEESWTVQCDGNTWRGFIGNCSQDSPPGSGSIFAAGSNFPYGILIVVAIGVALGVFFGGILLTLASFYMKRRRDDREAHPSAEQMYDFHDRKSMDTLSSYPYGRRPDMTPHSPRHEIVDPRYNMKDCGAMLEAPYNAYRDAPHSDVDFRPPHSPASHIYESPKFGRKAT